MVLAQLQSMADIFQNSAIVKINDDIFDTHHVELWLKRDDLLHPVVSGNKWRKLKYSLQQVLLLKKNVIVSMGGQYSNHIHALAYAGKLLGIKTHGLIRGEPRAVLTPTLQDALQWGMEIQYVSRTNYRKLRQDNDYEHYCGNMNSYWLPEGGASELALQGVAELVQEIDIDYDVICVACGTGTTLAGIVNVISQQIKAVGIAVLKHAEFLNTQVALMLRGDCHNWEINFDYHCGGYAKSNDNLLEFIENFQQKHNIALDRIYTGKMMYAIYELVKLGYFKAGQRIIAVHTGGLQGNRGD